MYSQSLSSQLMSIIQKKTLQAAISKNYQDLDTDALTLSIDMNYNRSNISRTLNSLNRGGFLIKIHGRPTYYLDKKTICDFYNLTQLPLELENLEQLKRLFLTDGRSITRIPITAFQSLIGCGANESLQPAIHAAMKMALYPASIHSYLITGPAGTGKQSFCQAVFQMEEELRNHQITQEPLWIEMNGPSAQNLLEALGSDHIGQNRCVAFLHADQAPLALLDKMVSWCNSLSRENSDHIAAYAILAEETSCEQRLLNNLYPSPSAISLPSLTARSMKELVLFILSSFQKQCDLLNFAITIDRPTFQSFVVANYHQNLRSLNNAVRETCQNTFFRCYPCSGVLPVNLSDVPDSVFNDTRNIQEILPALHDLESRVLFTSFKFIPQKVNPVFSQLREEALGTDGRLFASARSLFRPVSCPTLPLQCQQDLKTTRSAYEAGQNSKTFQLLFRILSPFLPGGDTCSSQSLYCGMLYHLSEVIHPLLTHSYQPALPPLESLPSEALSAETQKIIQTVQAQFDVELPLAEQQYIHLYLQAAWENRRPTRVKIAVLCHWNEIITVYQRYAASLLYDNQPVFFTYKKNSVGREHELQLRHILSGLAELSEDGGLIIISDDPPDEDLVKAVYQEIGRDVLFITHLSQDNIRKTLMFFDDPMATLEEFRRLLSDGDNAHFMVDSRITMRIKSLISDTLVFLDANKVFNALSDALNTILSQLGLSYNDGIAIRFIVHSAFMIERSIRRETLSYKRADEYLRQNKQLHQVIKTSMEPIQNLFNIQIPNSELAYLVEILSDYT